MEEKHIVHRGGIKTKMTSRFYGGVTIGKHAKRSMPPEVFAVSFPSPTHTYLLVRKCVKRSIVRPGHVCCTITHHSMLLIKPRLPMLIWTEKTQ